jgi:hypothetical protein
MWHHFNTCCSLETENCPLENSWCLQSVWTLGTHQQIVEDLVVGNAMIGARREQSWLGLLSFAIQPTPGSCLVFERSLDCRIAECERRLQIVQNLLADVLG